MYMYISNINLKYVFIHAGGLGGSGNSKPADLNPLNNLAANSRFGRMAQFGMGMIGGGGGGGGVGGGGSQENSNSINSGSLPLGRHKF